MVVVLNRYDDGDRLHRANRAVLEADAATVTGAGTRQGLDVVVDAGALVERWDL